jgi:hypothetical protein
MTTVVPARARACRLVVPALVALVALGAACAEVGTDPNAAVSIEFNRLPSPSILVGDTLRDLEGKATRLTDSVWLFNQANDTIAPSKYFVRFVTTVDSARLRYDSTTGYLISTRTTGLRTVGIQAQTGGLFPPAVSLNIVPAAPTRIDTVNADTTTLLLNFIPNVVLSESSKELTVRLRAIDPLVAGTSDTLVTGWPVRFRVVSLPASLDSVRFIASRSDTLRSSRQSAYDTTQAGTASRIVAAWRKPGAVATGDALVVEALFRVRTAVVGTVQWRIPLTTTTAAAASR